MKGIIFILLFIPIAETLSQVKITVSPRHQQRLSTIEGGHKRMMKFYRFFKKDSIRQIREHDRRVEYVMDSTVKANHEKEKALARLSRKGQKQKAVVYAETLNDKIQYWHKLYKDSASTDSVKNVAKDNLKQLTVERARLDPGFESALQRYSPGTDSANWKIISNEIPGMDSLSGFFSNSPNDFFATAEKLIEQKAANQIPVPGQKGYQLPEMEEAMRVKRLADQYKKEAAQYTDTNHLKEEGKDKALETASDQLEETDIEGARKKVSKLLSKYREFSNSNDLRDAVKHTSLEGKTFKERLLLGANINVISLEPFSADISPQIGYKFNTRFAVGIGMSHRVTLSDSIRSSWYIANRTNSLDIFTSYLFLKGFYAYGEWKRSWIPPSSSETTKNTKTDNYLVGVGKRFLVAPKLYLTLTALYNLNGQDNNPLYARRLQIRMGFQLSELAIRKKKIQYDPNR